MREPIFGLDVHSRADRADWSRRELFAPQPYLQFGVRTDGRLRAMKQGVRFDNLYAIGAVAGGYYPLQQGCGAGVSLIGALHVAQQIAANDPNQTVTFVADHAGILSAIRSTELRARGLSATSASDGIILPSAFSVRPPMQRSCS